MKKWMLAAAFPLVAAVAFAGGNPTVYPRETYLQVGDTAELIGSTQPGFSPYNYSHVYFWASPSSVAVGSGEVTPGYLTFGTKFHVTAVGPGMATVYYRWAAGGADYPAATIYVTQPCPHDAASMTVVQDTFVTTPTQPVTMQINTTGIFQSVEWYSGRLNEGGTRVQTGPSGTYTVVGLKPGRYYFWASAIDHCPGLAQRFEFRVDVVLPKRRAR